MHFKIFLAIIISLKFLYGRESHNYLDVKNLVSHYQKLFDSTEFGFGDLHNGVLARIFATGDPAALEDTSIFVNSEWIKESGLRLIFLSVGVPRFSMRNEDTVSIGKLLSFLRNIKNYISQNHPEFSFVNTDSEAIAGIEKEKICFVYALEGMNLINDELCWIDSLYDVGVRMVGIAHTFTDQIVINKGNENKKPTFTNDSSNISVFCVQAINKLLRLTA